MNNNKYCSLLLLGGATAACSVLVSTVVQSPASHSSEDLLRPAPIQTVGYFDYFGKLLNPSQAAELVRSRGLDSSNAQSYLRIGAVEITQALIDQGKDIFTNRKIGDDFGLQKVFGFRAGFLLILPEVRTAIEELGGKPTANLRIVLQKDLILGSRIFAKGSTVATGLDVEKGGKFPVGLSLDGNLTCAICHIAVDKQSGTALQGLPNGDLNIPLLIALSPNTAAGFARLNIAPLDPVYQGNGKTIIDSQGRRVELPDPQKIEQAFDDAVLDVPFGHFESSPDGINNTTQIPNLFTFRSGPYTADGSFIAGPFGGLSSVTNGVHSSEVNLLAASQISEATLGIDREVYLGTVLQNASDPQVRLPEGKPVKPSEWLRKVAPDPEAAELEDQVPAPGTGSYPNLSPSLFTFNGLVFSPNTDRRNDSASGLFLFAANAMAAFQNSLLPPANRSESNRRALATGAVRRGARVFEQASCTGCHPAPFFTDNRIHPVGTIGTDPARARSRLGLEPLLVPPLLFTFDTPVPIPPGAEILAVPTTGIAATPTSLPTGIAPDGGYKSPALRGLYLSAPYLHDGGAAVRAGALQFFADGSFAVVDSSGLGLAGTLSQGQEADAGGSLRALLDRDLRTRVVAANQGNPALVRSNLTGEGHAFYVDPAAGFTYAQQRDLVDFLLSLDGDPGRY